MTNEDIVLPESKPNRRWISEQLRLLWLVPASLLLGSAIREFIKHRELLMSIASMNAEGQIVPNTPTRFGEHQAMAVAFLCLAFVCAMLSSRRVKNHLAKSDRHLS